jgi:3-hydroxy acid dehydrogenase / malonic semialdehyde reductase
MENIVCITGATSGIGAACARAFAAAGHSLILTGRRKERLLDLQATLENLYPIKILVLDFDVQDRQAVAANLSNLPTNWQSISILINNAGLAAGKDSFENANLDDWDNMLHTNVNGLLYVSKAIVPYMIERQKGHIINIGSIAGKEVYENGNVYCASKFAVDAINKAMRIDLLKHQIKVTGIHPGAVETEFALVRCKGDAEKAAATYQGLVPLTAADIADTVFYCTQLPNHVCINDLVITCIQQASTYYFHKNL